LIRNIRHRTNDLGWFAELIRRGFGCGVLPRAAAEARALACRKLDGVALEHRTMLATVAGQWFHEGAGDDPGGMQQVAPSPVASD
jgi:hypothetical protein